MIDISFSNGGGWLFSNVGGCYCFTANFFILSGFWPKLGAVCVCVCVLFLLKIHKDSFYNVEMSLQNNIEKFKVNEIKLHLNS